MIDRREVLGTERVAAAQHQRQRIVGLAVGEIELRQRQLTAGRLDCEQPQQPRFPQPCAGSDHHDPAAGLPLQHAAEDIAVPDSVDKQLAEGFAHRFSWLQVAE